MPRETTWKVCKIKAASMAAGEGGGSPREGASSGACAPRSNPESLTSRLDCFGAFAPRSDGLSIRTSYDTWDHAGEPKGGETPPRLAALSLRLVLHVGCWRSHRSSRTASCRSRCSNKVQIVPVEPVQAVSLACRPSCSLAYFQPRRVRAGQFPGVPFEVSR